MRKFILTVCLSLLLPLSFCSSNKKEVVYISPQKEDVKQQESIPPNLPPGDFQEAIEVYHTEYQKNPNNKVILDNYIQTLEEVKLSADKAFDEGNYLLANNRYYILSKNFSGFESFQKSLSFDLETIRMRMRECLVKKTKIQADEAVQAGDYSRAIEAYQNALRAYPNDAYLANQLAQTITVINNESKKALERKDFAAAGKVSFLLLKNFGWLRDSISSLSFSKSSLENNIRNCTSQLTRKGIKLYREGELKKAIAAWKDILEFDPENVQIKKALANAQEQLAKIKK
jgi:tetratricopeptide (TPR) repeat protein